MHTRESIVLLSMSEMSDSIVTSLLMTCPQTGTWVLFTMMSPIIVSLIIVLLMIELLMIVLL